jgi:hemerythrin-like domain-containing protein
MTETQWEEYRSNAAELIERLQAHILKEEKALLPIIEDTLSPEDDLAYSERYAAMAA